MKILNWFVFFLLAGATSVFAAEAKSPAVLLQQGIYAEETEGNLDKAMQFYEKAIGINPKDQNAYYNMGNAYYDKGNLDRAIQSYEKVVELNPKYSDAYFNLGVAYDTAGNSGKAIEEYEKRQRRFGK